MKKANHVCTNDCFIGDVSQSPDGVLGQYHYHVEGGTHFEEVDGVLIEHQNEDEGWAEDVFVGPRAVYVLYDGDGEFDLPFAAPLTDEQLTYWGGQIVSGPHGSREAAFPVHA